MNVPVSYNIIAAYTDAMETWSSLCASAHLPTAKSPYSKGQKGPGGGTNYKEDRMIEV